MRATDYAFRLGGEEFLLVLKGASLSITFSQAEIMLKEIESLEFEFDGKKFNVTARFGVAVFTAPFNLTYEAMLEVVDKKLYAAKVAGRNCVIS